MIEWRCHAVGRYVQWRSPVGLHNGNGNVSILLQLFGILILGKDRKKHWLIQVGASKYSGGKLARMGNDRESDLGCSGGISNMDASL